MIDFCNRARVNKTSFFNVFFNVYLIKVLCNSITVVTLDCNSRELHHGASLCLYITVGYLIFITLVHQTVTVLVHPLFISIKLSITCLLVHLCNIV